MIIGIGCDIVEIKRIRNAMERDDFLRILTKEEREIYDTLSEGRRCEWVAGRFAAKEAIIKAMSCKHAYLLSDLSILYVGKQPVCHIEGVNIQLSISHEQEYAIAYAIAQEV